eukprot:Skav216069  [mRNA]  locus=scaffold389:163380:169820:- [translate_table: standard]
MEKIEDTRVDVVFATGKPPLRAMRWARILNSVKKDIPGRTKIRYCVAPETKRDMRYYTKFNADSLNPAMASSALQDEWKKAVGRIPPEMSNVSRTLKGTHFDVMMEL